MASDKFGTVSWNYDRDEDENFDGLGKCLILGRSSEPRRLCVSEPGHVVSVGPSGSGKGVSLVIPNLLTYWGSAVVVDPGGAAAWVTAPQRRRMLGADSIIVDPWGEMNRRYGKTGQTETVSQFDPLSILDPASSEYADDLAGLAEALVVSDSPDPFWCERERQLVGGLMALAVEDERLRGEAALRWVRLFLTQSSDMLRDICRVASEFGENSLAAKKLAAFTFDSVESASVIAAARTRTAFIDGMPAGQREPDFRFEGLNRTPATVYLVLPPEKIATCAPWLRLMVCAALRAVMRRWRLFIDLGKLPVLFVLDQCADMGHLPAVEQGYRSGAPEIALWTFFQDLDQLLGEYPDSWQTLIANSVVSTFFGVRDGSTSGYVSKMLGAGIDDIRGLDPGAAIIFGRGKQGLCRRILYYDDPRFRALAREHPDF